MEEGEGKEAAGAAREEEKGAEVAAEAGETMAEGREEEGWVGVTEAAVSKGAGASSLRVALAAGVAVAMRAAGLAAELEVVMAGEVKVVAARVAERAEAAEAARAA